jgi:predicted nucleic acid-binding protein
MLPLEAIAHVRSWLNCTQVQIVTPGPRHLEILTSAMESARASGRLTTDAHLAALAIETQSELLSNDVDFARFTGLRWVNPLRGR